MNPFDLIGANFLWVYIVAVGLGVMVANVVRWWMRQPGGAATEGLDETLSPYEIAFLAGGEGAAMDACLVRLVHHKVLGVSADDGQLTRLQTLVPEQGHPLEKAIAAAVADDAAITVARMREIAEPTADQMRGTLEKLGLVLSRERVNQICLVSSGVMVAVVVFGLIRLVMGLVQHRPLGFLVLLILLTFIPVVGFFTKRPFRSRRGDAALRQMRYDNDALRMAAGARAHEMNDADLVIALGLFGPAILVGSPYANVMPMLRRQQGDASSGSSSSCSSCSSCSSGDGGGSCGGGGCGGCGGGGD